MMNTDDSNIDDTNGSYYTYTYNYTYTPSSVFKMVGTMLITVVEIHVLVITYFTYYTLSAHWD